MHRIYENCQREPIDRALPRFSAGRVPCDQPASTMKRPSLPLAGTVYYIIRVGRALPDKAGESMLKRFSLVFSRI